MGLSLLWTSVSFPHGINLIESTELSTKSSKEHTVSQHIASLSLRNTAQLSNCPSRLSRSTCKSSALVSMHMENFPFLGGMTCLPTCP